MKTWPQKTFAAVVTAALLLVLGCPVSHISLPEGSVWRNEIVSYCVGDAANDGAPLLFAISGFGRTEEGERHGEFLLVCEASVEADLEKLGGIPPEKILEKIDLSNIKPMKVQLGDINGDGAAEISICVYKTAKFHPVMAKRPFFFTLSDGNLIPVWLGSRLSRPFDDFILCDINSDGVDEIIAIERLENNSNVLAVYNWKGFGFEVLTESDEFDGELRFDRDFNSSSAQTSEFGVIFIRNGDNIKLRFHMEDGLISSYMTNN